MGNALNAVHSDRWLNDSLRDAALHPRSWDGFAPLAQASERNAAGDPEGALVAARLASSRFAAASNRPAWARAKLEEIYALHRSARGGNCLSQSAALSDAILGRSYVWIEIQTALEKSVCASMLPDFVQARRYLGDARRLAPAGYEIVNLRTIGLQAALETVTGDLVSAWTLDLNGLAEYYRGQYPLQRGYQFYSDMSFIAQKSGQWRLAATIAGEAERTIADTANQSMTAMAAFRYGMLAERAGLDAAAAEGYQRAERLFVGLPRDEGTQVYRVEGDVSLALIEARRGQFAAAKQHLDNVSASISAIRSVTILLRYYQARGVVELHDGRVNEAETALRKAVSLAEPGFSSLSTPAQRASWTAETRSAYLALVELTLRERHAPAAALRIWTGYRTKTLLRAGVSARSRHPHAEGSGGKRHRSNESILTYVVFDHGVAIWRSKGPEADFRWVDLPERDLRAVAEHFTSECADPASPPAAFARDGQWLYRKLIEPIRNHLPAGDPIVLQPDGPIAHIPFTAIPTPDGGYLGSGHPLTISLSLDGGDREQAITPESRALVVANPALNESLIASFPPLAEAEREARVVAALFHRATVLVFSHANRTAIRSGLKSAEVFHFAGHAISGESGGALLLADDGGGGVLSAADIEDLRLEHCQLAVLSACSTATGAGPVFAEGLAGAFLRAGARRVVAARWRVDSVTARAYNELLYENLARGLPMGEALFRAAAAIRARPATSHPFYWAAFDGYE